MRIPTITQFQDQIQVMHMQMDRIEQLQKQAESGTKIQNGSDDPVLASQITAVNDYIGSLGDYDTNGKLAQNRYVLFSSTMQNAISVMDNVTELTQAAQNDTLNNSDRVNIANELQTNLQQLLSYANTQDGNGSYIFAGYNGNIPPFVQQNGVYQYEGTQDTTSIYLNSTTAVPYSASGYSVFSEINLGNGNFTVTIPGTNTGTATTSAGSVVNNALYIPDTYTISYVTNSAGQLAYQVVGVNSGQVIPAPPATIPADAPPYVADSDLTFNGMNIHISGEPNVGDSFQITPSTTQNLFNTLQQMITTLQTPINPSSASDKAAFHQAMTQSSASIGQAFDHLSNSLSVLGSQSSAIDAQVKSNNETITNQKIIMGQLDDADMAEVTSSLMQQNVELQATQEIYLKIQETLFDLLKNSTLS
jgi:flagellar hook-associated protein 3 FlgL